MTENAPVREVRVGLKWVTALVVAAALAAGAAWWFRLLPPSRGTTTPPPAWQRLTPAAAPSSTPLVTTGAAAAKLKRALRGDLGGLSNPRIAVAPLGGGDALFTRGVAPSPPASLNKLLTAAAALVALGPETRFATTTTLSGNTLTLVGGGDPLLASAPQPHAYPRRADLQTLAAQTATALRARGTTSVSLAYDSTLWQGPALSPHWPASYQPDNVIAPISALWVDEGRSAPLPDTVAAAEAEADDGLPGPAKVKDPAAVAAAGFAQDLARQGITVTGAPTPAASDPAAEHLAAVRSAPLRELLAWTLELSDNEAAETIAHHVGLAVAQSGSFEGGAAGVTQELQQLGVDTTGLQLYDGSGLSREDRVAPRTLVMLLQKAASDPRLGSLLGDLPTAGWTGSLADRFTGRATAGLGVVRAKTGTLTGVDALAGTVVDADGDALAFAVMSSGITNTLEARADLDQIGAALAACHCRTG